MPRADFYLIDKPRFREDPLLLVCELALRAFEQRQPTLILVRSEAEAEALDEKLWEFKDDAFVPHQIAGDEGDDQTAVLIVPPGIETAQRALVINLRDALVAAGCERVIEVVPADPAAREGSRLRWKAYAAMHYALAKHDM